MSNMIRRPTTSPTVDFQSEKSEHSIKVVTLNHLYSEAVATAAKLEGVPVAPPTSYPRTITIYDCFRTKLATHIDIPREELAEETVSFIVEDLEAKLIELKKNCIGSDNSAS